MVKRHAKTCPPALANFKICAVIDWVWISITLPSPSQFRHVQDRLRASFGKLQITALEGTASSSEFSFKLQDPAGPDELMQQLQCAVRPGDPPLTEGQVRILGVEIAIDAYHRGNDRQALAPAVLHFLVHHARPPAGPARITEPGTYRVAFSKREVLQALEAGYTLHCGAKDATHTSHFYVKNYDTIGDEKYAPLAPEKCRARFENTWRHEGSPFKTLAEWRNFKFESLSTSFALLVPTATKGLAKLIQERVVQLGFGPDAPKIRPSDRKKSAPFTRRDVDTNDAIRQALRTLTRTQSCENSVNILPAKAGSPEEGCDCDTAAPKYLNNQEENLTERSIDPAGQSPLTEIKLLGGSLTELTAGATTEGGKPCQSGQSAPYDRRATDTGSDPFTPMASIPDLSPPQESLSKIGDTYG